MFIVSQGVPLKTYVSDTGIKFKLSPFFRVEKAVSAVMECPGKSLSYHIETCCTDSLSRVEQLNGSETTVRELYVDQRRCYEAAIGQVSGKWRPHWRLH